MNGDYNTPWTCEQGGLVLKQIGKKQKGSLKIGLVIKIILLLILETFQRDTEFDQMAQEGSINW